MLEFGGDNPRTFRKFTYFNILTQHPQPSCYPDIAVRREVKKLVVICSNKKFGCDFIGTLENYFKVYKKRPLHFKSSAVLVDSIWLPLSCVLSPDVISISLDAGSCWQL